jgi:hypothetical protein
MHATRKTKIAWATNLSCVRFLLIIQVSITNGKNYMYGLTKRIELVILSKLLVIFLLFW